MPSTTDKINVLLMLAKNSGKTEIKLQKLNFSSSALFHMKIRVSLKYFEIIVESFFHLNADFLSAIKSTFNLFLKVLLR